MCWQDKVREEKIRFRRLVAPDGTMVTICRKADFDNGTCAYGMAFRSPRDVANRDMGRQVSYGRLQKALAGKDGVHPNCPLLNELNLLGDRPLEIKTFAKMDTPDNPINKLELAELIHRFHKYQDLFVNSGDEEDDMIAEVVDDESEG